MRKPSDSIAGTRHGVYGPPRGRQAQDDVRRGTPRPEVDLAAGSCGQLLPAVAERYFHATIDQRFERATAVSICLGCPVLRDCLTDGIAQATTVRSRVAVMRGGLTAWALAALHAEAVRSGVSPRVLADRELAHMLPPLRGAYGSDSLRRGDFASPALLHNEEDA